MFGACQTTASEATALKAEELKRGLPASTPQLPRNPKPEPEARHALPHRSMPTPGVG